MMNKYALYFSNSCYFCQKVLMHLHGKTHQIELRSVADPQHFQALNAGGGKTQVPCLMIQQGSAEGSPVGASSDDNTAVLWLYESDDILDYIRRNNLVQSLGSD